MAHPNAVPLEEVLPALLQQLPLKTDYAENDPVYRCLIQLLRANHAAVVPHAAALRQIFAQVLSPPKEQLTDELRAELEQVAQALGASDVVRQQQSPCITSFPSQHFTMPQLSVLAG
ncbi:hypothetical protein THASP1DRAFT_32587 [Thamnocephalis sphaerospora]|uniref:Uncharacterized protein n=1 Tax=Thamnocephalis sphaerospora TaxID=78915 RepID=A0A4P9XIP5_9FUNG|nr:hypothetical protein THASP1DRAFT_32587 [Thamnocephalis sphaerospora]|eukprot:RKP05576.1 hypothetical protein THASP1DRAFT_32587 [Thamnocephalis sphaerospora]